MTFSLPTTSRERCSCAQHARDAAGWLAGCQCIGMPNTFPSYYPITARASNARVLSADAALALRVQDIECALCLPGMDEQILQGVAGAHRVRTLVPLKLELSGSGAGRTQWVDVHSAQ